MRTSSAILSAFCLACVLACSSSPEPDSDAVDAALARADAAAKALMKSLGGALMATLEEGGPDAAIQVCARIAPERAAEISDEFGLDISRTALRWRNPANAPDEYERAWMEAAESHYIETGLAPEPSSAIVESDGAYELRYLLPLRLAGPCLQCHGSAEDLSSEVLATLVQHYPDDRATGFAVGDLRGIVTVRVPLD